MSKTLETFKIAEKHKPRITKSVTADTGHVQTAEAEKETLGFARIEAILDEDHPSEVSRQLTLRLDALSEYEGEAKNTKDRAAARKARIGIERTADLLGYLFHTKATLQPGEPPDAKKSSAKSEKSKKART